MSERGTVERVEELAEAVATLLDGIRAVSAYAAVAEDGGYRLVLEYRLKGEDEVKAVQTIFEGNEESHDMNAKIVSTGLFVELPRAVCRACKATDKWRKP